MKLQVRAVRIGVDRVFVQMGPDIKGYLDMPKAMYQKIAVTLLKNGDHSFPSLKVELRESCFDKWEEGARNEKKNTG